MIATLELPEVQVLLKYKWLNADCLLYCEIDQFYTSFDGFSNVFLLLEHQMDANEIGF